MPSIFDRSDDPVAARIIPPPLVGPLNEVGLNRAKWAYQRLGEYINDFESNLDDDREIGARLVSFGSAVTFHIEDIGYYGPDIISFTGLNDSGERVQLIQNISHLSVLLIAVRKLGEKPRRIGFTNEADQNAEN